jgi:small subunit ribosomal protein S13
MFDSMLVSDCGYYSKMAEDKIEQSSNSPKLESKIPNSQSKALRNSENLAKPKPAAQEGKKDNFKYIVRVANTDLDGNQQIGFALRKVTGVNYSFANAICRIANIDHAKKTGYLSDAEIEKLSGIVTDPVKAGMPGWIFNRRKDPETGEDHHLILGGLQFAKENDIKMMKKMKCYRGSRHALGLPSRGQRTKSNFRRSKSRGKGSLGVVKSKARKSGK